MIVKCDKINNNIDILSILKLILTSNAGINVYKLIYKLSKFPLDVIC